jgi:hypothetical protein
MTQLLDPHQLEGYRTKLDELRLEHRDLDDVISRLAEDPHVDQLQLRRLKKRKLSRRLAQKKLGRHKKTFQTTTLLLLKPLKTHLLWLILRQMYLKK